LLDPEASRFALADPSHARAAYDHTREVYQRMIVKSRNSNKSIMML